jgi:serine/threonine protein kinase/WD40 repeat protein
MELRAGMASSCDRRDAVTHEGDMRLRPEPNPNADTSARQALIEAVFDQAISKPEGERIATVEQSALDETGRREVIELLRYHADKGSMDTTLGLRPSMRLEERLIGMGGMGAVYQARQQHPARRVAIKMLRGGIGTGSTERRFQLEAELMSRLEHPGIARIYAAGKRSGELGTPYFIMEFVESARAVTVYCREQRLPMRARIQLFCDILDAIAYGHARGVIHRDLKPANILVDTAGRARVIDFGIAKAIDSEPIAAAHMTATTNFVGTLQYMSPEQFSVRDGADARSDVHALGLVMFESLAERLPYEVPRHAGILVAARTVTDSRAPLLGSIVPRLRGDIETIIAKALEKDPAARYSTVAEFAADLRRALAHEPVLARRPTLNYQLSRFIQRNKAFSASITAAIFLLAGTSAVALRFAIDARHQSVIAAIGTAQYAIEVGDFPAAREALASIPVASRSFEWSALNSRAGGWIAEVQINETTGEDDGNIYEVLDARDGAVFVAAGQSHVVVVDSRDGRVLTRVRDPRPNASTETLSLDVDADAQRIVLGGMKLAPIVLSLESGKVLWEGAAPRELFSAVAISSDGARVAWANIDEPLRVNDVATGAEIVSRAFGAYIRSMDFSPDGALLAIGISPARLVVVDAATLTEKWTATLRGSDDVPDVRFSRDGRFVSAIAFAGLTDVFTREGAPHSGIAVETMAQIASYAGEISHDGTRIACGAMDQFPRVQDVATGRSFRLPGHDAQAWSIAWGAHRETLATVGKSIRIWNLAQHDSQRTAIASSASRGIRLSSDGALAATIEDGTQHVVVVDNATRQEIRRFPGGAQRIAIDAPRRRIAIFNGVLSVYSIDTAVDPACKTDPLWRHTMLDLAELGIATVSAIEHFSDGRLCVSSGNTSLLSLDGATGAPLATADFTQIVEANPVISEPSPIVSLRPTDDGAIVGASSLPPGIFRWSGRAGSIPVIASGRMSYRRLCVGARGGLVATSDVDGGLQIMENHSLRELIRCDPLTASGRFIAIHPNGERLALASQDQRLAIVDAQTDERIVRIPLPAMPSDLRFSSDGSQLVVGLANGRLIILGSKGISDGT